MMCLQIARLLFFSLMSKNTFRAILGFHGMSFPHSFCFQSCKTKIFISQLNSYKGLQDKRCCMYNPSLSSPLISVIDQQLVYIKEDCSVSGNSVVLYYTNLCTYLVLTKTSLSLQFVVLHWIQQIPRKGGVHVLPSIKS